MQKFEYRVKKVFDNMGIMAKAYLPPSIAELLIDLCAEVDRLGVEVEKSRSISNEGK